MEPILNNLTKTLRSLFSNKINKISHKKSRLNSKDIFNKTHANNLISQLTSSQNLELAFCEYCKNNLNKGDNHLVWDFKKNWESHKINIRQDLLQSKFLLAPLTKYSIEGESYGSWEPASAIVLHALKQVLEPYLKLKMDLTYASHLKDYGGLKGGVEKAQKLIKKNKFVYKTDIKSFYDSINHHILIEQLSEHITDQRILDLILQYCERC